MEIFFRYLTQKLDKDRLNWRSNTVIILDNAPYHNSKASMKLYETLNLPITFTGPHSYDGAPCELLFALIKSENLNPRHLKMSK